MRTSFHHQSEAQSPNGPLTAATSPDTPSPRPTTQSCANPEFPVSTEHPHQPQCVALSTAEPNAPESCLQAQNSRPPAPTRRTPRRIAKRRGKKAARGRAAFACVEPPQATVQLAQ